MRKVFKCALMSGLLCSPFMLSGQAYFQQQVDHVIEVSLDDERHILHASQEITYKNNSPATLDTIWMHLWPNAYGDLRSALKDQMVRSGNLDLHFASADEIGWIDSLDFKVLVGFDITRVPWGYHERHSDIAWIKLPHGLVPGGSIRISTPFRVKIPSSKFSRLGHTGQAYHVTQWFPKPAVYDAQGWHPMPYLTQGEFYSEFGTFDVSLTLPKNYIVGATGILQDATEVAWMDSLAALPAGHRRLKILLPGMEDAINAFPVSSGTTKTIRYVQDNVHDFAWFADKRFQVRKSSVTLPRSGRTVTTWAMFTPKNAELWSDAVSYVDESVRAYSEWVGDYPYEACTAIDGTISAGGGMEYPMITIIGDMGSKESLDNVIAHEVGHNWFYGILASNEREHPWMDEGMNSFLEMRYMRMRYPDGGFIVDIPLLQGLTRDVRDRHSFQSEAGYRVNARRNLDQPPGLPSTHFTSLNYFGAVYAKSGLVFDHLFAYLGEETFDRCMHTYFDEWKFKHPRPEDVRATFERVSGKDLAWVFDELIDTNNKVDLKALKLKGNELRFKSRSNTAVPFPITAWRDTVLLGTTWSDGAIGKGTTTLPWTDADMVSIDHDQRTLDIDRRNNQVNARGLFRRSSFPHIGFLTGLERHDRSSVYWTPLVARNGHDGWHLGIGLHNYHFPSQRTEWIVAPMYAFDSERLIGGARIEHHFDRMQSRLFQNIGIALNARSASTFHTDELSRRYSKLAPSVDLDLKRDPLARPWRHRIGLRAIYLRHDATFTTSEGVSADYFREDLYGELSYTVGNSSALLPTLVQPVFTAHEDFARASVEIGQGVTYNKRKDQIRLRAFAGTFLWKRDHAYLSRLEVWRLSWGPEDMLFDHAYLERGGFDTSFRGRQFNKQQGAFRTPFIQGASDSWIGAMNMEIDLPIGLPISLFGSAGIVPMRRHTGSEIIETTATYYEGGVGVQLMKDVIEVWFPLIVSQRIADEEAFHDRGIAERIRFVVAFERLDPTRLLRNVKP